MGDLALGEPPEVGELDNFPVGRVEGVESESLLFLLDEAGLCASAASACASGAMEPSHVLAAMGVEPRWAAGALRMTLGRTTTDVDVDRAIDILTAAITTLRARTPQVAR